MAILGSNLEEISFYIFRMCFIQDYKVSSERVIFFQLALSTSVPNKWLDWSEHCMKSVQIRSFFWCVFSRIRTEYGEILRISPYSIRMWENTDQNRIQYECGKIRTRKNSVIGHILHTVGCTNYILNHIYLINGSIVMKSKSQHSQ